jgi:multidrug efflux pump
MNVSYPFIRRPIATALLAIGVFLIGVVAYFFLPVASLPSVDIPTIVVSAGRPGADPEIMAATVAAPLERHLGEIAGLTELTSTSTFGSTAIVLQFDFDRNVDGAAHDVQAALNAAAADLPSDLPQVPSYSKFNPASAPILIFALTSKTLSQTAIYNIADTVIAQRISQIEGVAQATVAGADQPAVRVRVNPAALASIGVGIDDVRNAIVTANALGPLGAFDGSGRTTTIGTNAQLHLPVDYQPIVVKTANGNSVPLSSIASIAPGVRNVLSAAWFNHQPSELLIVTKQANANVIETVNRVHAVLAGLKDWIPADLEISVLSDNSTTIRASVHDMQVSLGAAVGLVMLIVFLFLRRGAPTIAAGITIPLTLAGTCAAMWATGFSLDNLSLLALAACIGFVVDDAIVMIENMYRNLEAGSSPLRATIEGARQIGFTVVSISLSLVAAFIPLLFAGGVVGKFLREFSLTLVFAIMISTVISLTVTPMICAHFVREPSSARATRLDQLVDAVLSLIVAAYARTLHIVLRHRGMTFLAFLLTISLTIALYVKLPKGFLPEGDSGLVLGTTEATPGISFEAMSDLQQRVAAVVEADPAVAGVASSIGTSGLSSSMNQGLLFVSLKPLSERGTAVAQVIDRLRPQLARIVGLSVFMASVSDVRAGGRQSKARYQFTLWGSDLKELSAWAPKVVDAVKQVRGVVDVSTDHDQAGLQANVVIDRLAAARMCVQIQDIDNALSYAFAQAQISTVYTERNQSRVVLEIDRQYQRDPTDLTRIYVKASGSAGSQNGCAGAVAMTQTTNASTGVISGTAANEVPLSALARFERGLAPVQVNHQGQFPAITVTYNLTAETTLEAATSMIQRAVAGLRLPDVIHADLAGDLKAFAQAAGKQPPLLLAALIAVYIVLGVLYESLAHPLTILSTIPAAGLGALLALQLAGAEVTLVAFIGIVLLIGIVKKNGIMLVDFALEGERRRGLAPEQAIYEACLERFRPILMTNLASILGAVPLAIAQGPGSELRRPLGIAIIGGLIVSQVLTLYTTPVIYLMLNRLHRKFGGSENGEASKADPGLRRRGMSGCRARGTGIAEWPTPRAGDPDSGH